MRNEERTPGYGLRSLQLWRRVSAARRELEQARAAGAAAPAIGDLLRSHGIDNAFIDALQAEMPAVPETPANLGGGPDMTADMTAPHERGCVVRSETGRISLRVV